MMRKSPIGIGLLLLLPAALMLGGLMETGHSAGQKVTPIFERALANAPGKKLVAVRLDYAAGGGSAISP